MMSAIGGFTLYGMGMIISVEKDYGTTLSTGYVQIIEFQRWGSYTTDLSSARFAFLVLFSSEITGFAFAAFCRVLFIYPASIIWPSSLVTSALLHSSRG